MTEVSNSIASTNLGEDKKQILNSPEKIVMTIISHDLTENRDGIDPVVYEEKVRVATLLENLQTGLSYTPEERSRWLKNAASAILCLNQKEIKHARIKRVVRRDKNIPRILCQMVSDYFQSEYTD